MARDVSDTTPVTSKAQLINWLEAGMKPPASFRLGTEHEKFPFYIDDLAPVPYDGDPAKGLGGIRHLLEGLQQASGWEPIWDHEALIGLADPIGGGAVSLEPGGQFELSGAPLDNVHQTAEELTQHVQALKAVAQSHRIGFLGLGMSPLWSLAQTPRMPKSRYKIMTDYMPKVGSRGLDMMYRTCTVQVNVDFSTEADMVKKLRVSLALQPLATALFANSPFTEGRLNGRLSERSQIWLDTDNQRAGMLPFAFEEGMGFERYVDYALDVPMYFVKRGDVYHDVAGANFRDLLAGHLPHLPGEQAKMSDWANHLSTIFPEVRLKRYLEMRGGDVGPPDHIAAFSAFFTGFLYDQSALDAAWDVVKSWSAQERQTLREAVPTQGLQAMIGGVKLQDIAREILKLSRSGLTQRKRLNSALQDETIYLDQLENYVATGRVSADLLKDRFAKDWQGQVRPVFQDMAF